MQRTVLIFLILGSVVSGLVLGMLWFGAFDRAEAWLDGAYQRSAIAPAFGDSFQGRWIESVMIIFLAYGVTWCVMEGRDLLQKMLVGLGALAFVLLSSLVGAFYGVLVEPFSGLTSVILAGSGALVYSGTERGMRKHLLRQILGERCSIDVFRNLLEAEALPPWDGAKKQVSVVSCHLFLVKETSELESPEIVRMNNLFRRSVSAFFLSKGAYLDESEPDSIRAFFGLIDEGKDPARRACEASLELRSRLRNLSEEWQARWFRSLSYGIGISTGEVVGGIFGSPERRYFSAVGNPVEISRRLAQGNLRYHSDLLIDVETQRAVEGMFEVRPLEMVYNSEEDVMVETYQLLEVEAKFTEQQRERRDHFWRGMIEYREGKLEKALESFSTAKNPAGEDPALERIVEQIQDRLSDDPDGAERKLSLTGEEGHARLIDLT